MPYRTGTAVLLSVLTIAFATSTPGFAKPAPKPIDTSALTKLGVKEIIFAARECGADGHWYANFGYYSYDVKRKLYRKEGRLCKLDLASGKTRLITGGGDTYGASYDPVYLPDGNILFNSTRCVQIVDCWWTEVSNLYVCNKDGKYLRRLAFDQVH